MGYLLYGILFGLLVFIFIKNFTLIKKYKHNKEYIECYKDVLNSREGAYDRICKYVENEKEAEFVNKGKLVKLYQELIDGTDCTNTLNELNIRSIFTNSKGSVNKELVSINSDSFIFVMLILSKAYVTGKLDVINEVTDKVMSIIEMTNRVEYNEIIAIKKALLDNDGEVAPILNSLLNGEYTDYQYDKNMIGIYKRIAAATLVFKKQEIEEFFNDDLKAFVKTMVGKAYMKDLGLFEQYHQEEVAEEPAEETVEIENKEEENK